MKSVRIQSFSGPYFSGPYSGPEKLQILTFFTQCNLCLKFEWNKIFRLIPSGNLFSIQEATSWYCRDSQLKLQISRRKKLLIKHNFSKKPKSLSLLSNRNMSDMLFIVMILSFLCYFIYHFSSGKLASLKLLLVSFGLKGYTGKKISRYDVRKTQKYGMFHTERSISWKIPWTKLHQCLIFLLFYQVWPTYTTHTVIAAKQTNKQTNKQTS